jgi:hypothetical protein
MKIRKNDKAYLLDLKIEIGAKSDTSFQELCLLFDKSEFLDLLPVLRRDLGIREIVGPEEFIDEAYDKPFNSKEKKKINLSKYKGVEEIKKFIEKNESFFGSGGIEKEMDMYQLVATEIDLICIRFNRPPYFGEAIRQAIYCGMTVDESFHPTSAEIIENSNAYATASYFKLPQAAIFVSPTSTYEDVKSALRQINDLYSTEKSLSYYRPRVDIIPNIKKYREWYWERIKGKTYQIIADEWVEKFENETTTYLDILKAVKTYEKLLAL